MSLLPVTGFYHLGVVVPDIRRSIEHFSRVFGIPRWDLQRLTNANFTKPLVHDRDVPQHFASALAIGGPVGFELCQPLSDDSSVYAEHLQRFGAGLHHAHFTIVEKNAFAPMEIALRDATLSMAQSAEISPTVDYYYSDTTQQLGGLAEILVIKGPNPTGGPPEIVEFGPEVTADGGASLIQRLYRFGVDTPDDVAPVEAGYRSIFGMTEWRTLHSVGSAGPDISLAGRVGPLAVELRRGDPALPGPRMQAMTIAIVAPEEMGRTHDWLVRKGLPFKAMRKDDRSALETFVFDGGSVLDGCDLEVISTRKPIEEVAEELLLAS